LLGYGARGAFVFVLALIIGAQIAARLGKTAKPDG
jgi:hypothetical protein